MAPTFSSRPTKRFHSKATTESHWLDAKPGQAGLSLRKDGKALPEGEPCESVCPGGRTCGTYFATKSQRRYTSSIPHMRGQPCPHKARWNHACLPQSDILWQNDVSHLVMLPRPCMYLVRAVEVCLSQVGGWHIGQGRDVARPLSRSCHLDLAVPSTEARASFVGQRNRNDVCMLSGPRGLHTHPHCLAASLRRLSAAATVTDSPSRTSRCHVGRIDAAAAALVGANSLVCRLSSSQ